MAIDRIHDYIVPGKRAHLVGIGGVSMSPLAEVLQGEGLIISGSDMKESPAVEHLRSLGIPVTIGHLPENVAGKDLVIRPRTASLPRYALTALEYAQYQADGADWPAFYALWTRKEAWCKYTGQGLRRQWGEDIPTDGLFLRSYQGSTWRAALCGEEAPPTAIEWKEAAP